MVEKYINRDALNADTTALLLSWKSDQALNSLTSNLIEMLYRGAATIIAEPGRSWYYALDVDREVERILQKAGFKGKEMKDACVIADTYF